MKIIVTGSEGFIGKALTAYLDMHGISWIGVDRKGTSNGRNYGICEANEIEKLFYLTDRPTHVIHLAAQTSVFNENLQQIRRDNIDTFMKVVDVCNRHHAKLVYASSSTANPGNTTSLYGISKHFDEEFARCYAHNATGARFHNVYGPDPRQGTLLWHLLNDNRVELYNDGKNRRHFTYIDDVLRGLMMCCYSTCELVNIANPEETSVTDFCNIFNEQLQAYNKEKHRNFQIDLSSSHIRHRDNIVQSVDEKIKCLPLRYMSVQEGLKKVLMDNRTIEALENRHRQYP